MRESLLQCRSRRENSSCLACFFFGESGGELERDAGRVAGRLELRCDAHGGDALACVGQAELVVDAERAGEGLADVGCAERGREGEKGR